MESHAERNLMLTSTTRIRPYLVMALALAAFVATAILPARADAIRCGATVVRDITLDTSLEVCPGDGLVVGANGVDIDLNGQTITGTGLGTAIRVNGYEAVTVTNGTLVGFDYGVELSHTLNSAVRNVTTESIQNSPLLLVDADTSRFSNNVFSNSQDLGVVVAAGSTGNVFTSNEIVSVSDAAFTITDSANNRFESNLVDWSGDRAFYFERSARASLIGNTISNTSDSAVEMVASRSSKLIGNQVTESSDAVFQMRNSGSSRFENNRITGSSDSAFSMTNTGSSTFTGNRIRNVQDAGLFVSSSSNTVTNNRFANVGDSGLAFFSSSNNLVEGNTFTIAGDAGIGITDGHDNQVLSNVVSGASDAGIFLQFSHGNRVYGNIVTYNESGVELDSSNSNVIEANDVTGSRAAGISMEDSSANQVLSNIANATGSNGIFATRENPEAEETLLGRNIIDGNRAHDNLTNGIFVEIPGARVSNNRTFRNFGYGIKGVPGVRGAGNLARDNGEPLQCLYVRCIIP
jgi:parallel beta-helix repeat protein